MTNVRATDISLRTSKGVMSPCSRVARALTAIRRSSVTALTARSWKKPDRAYSAYVSPRVRSTWRPAPAMAAPCVAAKAVYSATSRARTVVASVVPSRARGDGSAVGGLRAEVTRRSHVALHEPRRITTVWPTNDDVLVGRRNSEAKSGSADANRAPTINSTGAARAAPLATGASRRHEGLVAANGSQTNASAFDA